MPDLNNELNSRLQAQPNGGETEFAFPELFSKPEEEEVVAKVE